MLSYVERQEGKAERDEKRVVAERCATTWRDANARRRGDAFKQPVVTDRSEAAERIRSNGERVMIRGGGFYGGWKR